MLQWGETVWKWTSNGPIAQAPDKTRVNMEERWNDIDRGN